MDEQITQYEDRLNWLIAGDAEALEAIRDQMEVARRQFPHLRISYIKRRIVELGLIAFINDEKINEGE